VVLHCGAAWSQRSQAVAARLAEWAHSGPEAAGVTCVTADLTAVPDLVARRAIKGMPAVLFMRGGKVETRADGADVEALERILKVASNYGSVANKASPALTESWSAPETLALADDLWRQGVAPETIATFYEHALRGDAAFAFRARLGLLRCALEACEVAAAAGRPPAEDAVERAVGALAELQERHEDELYGVDVREDSMQVAQHLARAGLLIDAWSGDAEGEEAEVLDLYAKKYEEAAIDVALQWYRTAATNDMDGLVAAYCVPHRLIPDRAGSRSSRSIYAQDQLACEIPDAPGPAAPRAMLRRLIAALGPMHDSAMRARVELEVLLDNKPFVPFHTRVVYIRRGGPPKRGWGTGKRSGYSKRYWVTYGPGTMRPNSKKMGSPHCDKND